MARTKYQNQKTLRVAGVTFEGRQGKLVTLKKAARGAYLTLRREKNNAHDPNAVAVIAVLPNGTHMKIGYIPKSQNAEIARVLDEGNRTRVRQFSVLGGKGYNYGCELKVAF